MLVPNLIIFLKDFCSELWNTATCQCCLSREQNELFVQAADLGVMVESTEWALLKTGAQLALLVVVVRPPLQLANVRQAFVVAGVLSSSSSSSFSLSFSSYNTSTWA